MLPDMPPSILTTNFPVKVTIRSSTSIAKNIQCCLTNEDKKLFRRYRQLGCLLDLSNTGKFFGALAYQLLLRKVDCQKEHKVQFLVEGKLLRFSLNELVLIFGLYTYGALIPIRSLSTSNIQIYGRSMIAHQASALPLTVSSQD